MQLGKKMKLLDFNIKGHISTFGGIFSSVSRMHGRGFVLMKRIIVTYYKVYMTLMTFHGIKGQCYRQLFLQIHFFSRGVL